MWKMVKSNFSIYDKGSIGKMDSLIVTGQWELVKLKSIAGLWVIISKATQSS